MTPISDARRRLFLAAAASAWVLMLPGAADAVTALPALAFASPTAITLTLDGAGTEDTSTVTVVNPGDAEAVLAPRLEGTGADAVAVTADPTRIPAGGALAVTLRFTSTTADAPSSGTLVLAADGFAPATVPVTIGTSTQLRGPVPVIAFALVLGLGLVAARLATLRGRYPGDGTLGGVTWDFGSSWATNITTVGAVLGTVVAGGLLAEQRRQLAAQEVGGLSIAFGTIAVLAGFFYTVFQDSVVGADGEPFRQGYVRPFLVAAAATVVAVIGQLATLALVLVDGLVQGAGGVPAVLLLLLVILAAALVVRHVWTTLGWMLLHIVKPRPPRTRGGPGGASPTVRSPAWPLL